MKINKIQVNNFRNLKKIEYEPIPGLNIFVGDNAQGKTNLLEALFVLSEGGSFRSANDADLINHESSGYFLAGSYDILGRPLEATFDYNKNTKIFKINNKKVKLNHKDRIRVVLFTPDDLFIVKGSPGKRRAFLDFIIKQLSSDYVYYLDNYYSILRKRNLLLKTEKTIGRPFRIVNEIFAENAARIVMQRINFINLLDEIARPIYKEINEAGNDLKLRYALTFTIDSDKINTGVILEKLSKHIEENLEKEINRKKTLVGPHLDDINFYQDGRLARTFASQGQQRNIAISLKMAEIYVFKKIKGFYPVFLLDEVLSELDEGKRKLLINHLREAAFQTFLTSVNADNVVNEKDNIFIVKEGRILRKES